METNEIKPDVTHHTDRLTIASSALAHGNRTKSAALKHLRDEIVKARTAGVLTVAQIAKAVGRDRSAIDSIWAAYGQTVKGKQTRVTISDHGADSAQDAIDTLTDLASAHRYATDGADRARAVRDQVIVDAYKSKVLGPTAIAALSGIDRNHVLRVARKAGVAPAHRTNPKNQWTKSVEAV